MGDRGGAWMRAVPPRRLIVFAAIVVVGLSVDLATKSWAFSRLGMPQPGGPVIWVVPGVLSLETSLNEGALFGIGQGRGAFFAIASVLAALGISYWLFAAGAARDRALTVALAAVMAGICGNLFDRLGLPGLNWNYPPERIGEPVYAVRDWIHFKIEGLIDWPVFNIADSLLVCGAALLLWHAFWNDAPENASESSSKGPS